MKLRIKQIICVIMSITICLIILPFGSVAIDENYDSLVNSIFITNNSYDYDLKEADIDVSTIKQAQTKQNNADVIIVNFDEMYDSTELTTMVKDNLIQGKIFFIRASGHTTNNKLIEKVLGYENPGEIIRESEDEAMLSRSGTFGFMVYLDSSNNLQVVRQKVMIIDDVQTSRNLIENQFIEQIQVDDELHSLSIPIEEKHTLSFLEEMEAIDGFLDCLPNFKSIQYDGETNSQTQASKAMSNFTSYTYEKVYDTTYYQTTVYTDSSNTKTYKIIGAITRCLYAERLYCASSNHSDTSAISSKWGYMSDIQIQPKWYQSTTYRSLNDNLKVIYSTYPSGTSNATYKMILRDYTPKVDLTGKTDVTLSVGLDATASTTPGLSGSAGFNVSTSFEDIKITVDTWQIGMSYDYNGAGINFEIGNASRLLSKNVNQTTISLTSGVVLWNYATKYSCIQLNFEATWKILQGLTSLRDINVMASEGIVWQPANLY